MSGESHNLFTQSQTFPKYVSDETLKRARVDTADGPSIRVAGTFSGSSTDLTSTNGKIDDVKTAVDTVNTSVGSVNTTLGTTNSKLTDINSNILTNNTLTGETNTRIGNKADSAWNGISTEASVISILKKIDASAQTSTDLTTTNGKIDDVKTAVNTVNSSVGSVDSTLVTMSIPIETTATSTQASSTTLGSKSDAAWDGITANPSVISLLKGIVNKL